MVGLCACPFSGLMYEIVNLVPQPLERLSKANASTAQWFFNPLGK